MDGLQTILLLENKLKSTLHQGLLVKGVYVSTSLFVALKENGKFLSYKKLSKIFNGFPPSTSIADGNAVGFYPINQSLLVVIEDVTYLGKEISEKYRLEDFGDKSFFIMTEKDNNMNSNKKTCFIFFVGILGFTFGLFNFFTEKENTLSSATETLPRKASSKSNDYSKLEKVCEAASGALNKSVQKFKIKSIKVKLVKNDKIGTFSCDFTIKNESYNDFRSRVTFFVVDRDGVYNSIGGTFLDIPRQETHRKDLNLGLIQDFQELIKSIDTWRIEVSLK